MALRPLRTKTSPRWSRVWLAGVLILAVALIGLVLSIAVSRREPSYQGKPLSEWVKGYDSFLMNDSRQERIDHALRQMGKRAVPSLIRMLHARNSPLKLELARLLARQHLVRFHFDLTRAEEIHRRALYGLGALGPSAGNAVPDLVQYLRRSHQNTEALWVLGEIGPGAETAIPALLARIPSADDRTAWAAAYALSEIGQGLVPSLLQLLGSKAVPPQTRLRCAWALGMMGPKARTAVPSLVNLAEQHRLNDVVARGVVQALGLIGISSEKATIVICRKMATEHNWRILRAITNGALAQAVVPSVGEKQFRPGSMPLVGWMSYVGRIGIRRSPSPSKRDKSFELGPDNPPGCIEQTIRTEIGERLALSFVAAPGRNRSGEVRVGNLDTYFEPRARTPSGFTLYTYSFEAVSRLTTLCFRTLGRQGYGPFISDVAVQTVPAPTAAPDKVH